MFADGINKITIKITIEITSSKCFLILGGTPVAKATLWTNTDAEVRKRGERTGLDTPVVLAVNDLY